MGGFIGENNGAISSSYSTGIVTVGNTATNVGGFVGDAGSGSIANSYTLSPLIVGSSATDIGGFAGRNSVSSAISNSYSTGYISVGSASSNIGGFVGENKNNITNSFWNTDTSGQSAGFGSNTGTITNLTGGCVGVCTNGGTANMFAQATFSSAPYNWNFSSTWKIIEGQSYPYLQVFYTTPRIISGSSNAVANTTIALAMNGVVVDTAQTGANGFYYFFEGVNIISNLGTSLPDSQPILLYAGTGAAVGNTVAITPASTGSLSGTSAVSLLTNTLLVGSSSLSSTISTSNIITARGNLSNANILYSVTGGNHIALNNGISLAVTYHLKYR